TEGETCRGQWTSCKAAPWAFNDDPFLARREDGLAIHGPRFRHTIFKREKAPGRVLRHMGGDVEVAQIGDEGLCVIAFVGAQRQASRPWRAPDDHLNGRLPAASPATSMPRISPTPARRRTRAMARALCSRCLCCMGRNNSCPR